MLALYPGQALAKGLELKARSIPFDVLGILGMPVTDNQSLLSG